MKRNHFWWPIAALIWSGWAERVHTKVRRAPVTWNKSYSWYRDYVVGSSSSGVTVDWTVQVNDGRLRSRGTGDDGAKCKA